MIYLDKVGTVTDWIHENGYISLHVCTLQTFCVRTKFTWAHSAPWMERKSTHWERFHADSRTYLEMLESWNLVAQHFLKKGQVAFFSSPTCLFESQGTIARSSKLWFMPLKHWIAGVLGWSAMQTIRGRRTSLHHAFAWHRFLMFLVCVFDQLGHLSKDRGMPFGGVLKVHKLFAQHI